MKSELGVILMVIVLAILSIVFGVFAYLNFKEIDGNDKPEDAYSVRIDKEKQTARELKDQIEEYEGKKQVFSQQITKTLQLGEYYKKQMNEFKVAHEKRLGLAKQGKDFEQLVKDISGVVTKTKTKTLGQVEADITTARTDMEKKLADVTAKKAVIQAEVLAKKNDFQAVGKKHVVEMNYVNSQLGDTKQVLRDLTTREVIHAKILDRADGKVVLADYERNFVSIDLGTGDGVKNGFRFEVFAMLPGNKHVTKAYIEVRDAGEKQSQCVVLRRPVVLPQDSLSGYLASEPEEKYSPIAKSGKAGASAEKMSGGKVVMSGQTLENPIVDGDLIQNPFYEAGVQRVFYIAGSKEVVGERQKSAVQYRWTEIRDAAERYGAKVLPAVDTSVNYVIAQKNPQDDPEFKKAVDLGIPVIYEWELFRFLDNN